jgi:hypothetical protein
VRRAFSFLLLLASLAAAAPKVQAASERTLKARILEIDRGKDRVRADVRGRATVFRLADGNVLRGFRKGDLVFLRVRGSTVIDARLAVIDARVVRADERAAVLRIGDLDERFGLARASLHKRLHRGDFVRVEVEERAAGGRVITRVY